MSVFKFKIGDEVKSEYGIGHVACVVKRPHGGMVYVLGYHTLYKGESEYARCIGQPAGFKGFPENIGRWETDTSLELLKQ